MTPIAEIFSDYTLRIVSIGAMILGATSGVLGSFAVLRRQALIGDSVSHSALPGIAVAYLVTSSKSPMVLVVGAALFGILGMVLVTYVTRTTRIKEDSALGIVLSVFFGWGMVLLTFIQKMPTANKAGLDKFLFGQAAGLLKEDIWTMAVLSGAALSVTVLLWKEFKVVIFDGQFAQSYGLPVRRLDLLLTALIVLAIVVGLQTVGVVLMSAMIIAPAAAARQWTNRLSTMVLLAALFGGLSGVIGVVLSSTTFRMPTGPLIVLTMTFITLISFLFGTSRGLLWNYLIHRSRDRNIEASIVLESLYILADQHRDFKHAHEKSVIDLMVASGADVTTALSSLRASGLVREVSPQHWILTDTGRQAARRNIQKTGK